MFRAPNVLETSPVRVWPSRIRDLGPEVLGAPPGPPWLSKPGARAELEPWLRVCRARGNRGWGLRGGCRRQAGRPFALLVATLATRARRLT